MIRCRSVYLTRSQPLLQGVDLCVDEGHAVLLSGASGSGKSTLIEALYGAARPDSGSIELLHCDIGKLRRASLARLRRRIGVMPQGLELLEQRTVAGNLALPLHVQSAPRALIRVRTAQLLERMDMAEFADARISDLSMGQRQLVALARALIAEPRALLLDEPTAHLDLHGRTVAIELIADALARGCTALISSTDHKLLHSGAHLCWSHVELRGGVVQVVADRTEQAHYLADDDDRDMAGTATSTVTTDSRTDDAGDGFEIFFSEQTLTLTNASDMVRFPTVTPAGGLSE